MGSLEKLHESKVARNNIIFNELFLDFTTDLVIVEGVFDAMKAGHEFSSSVLAPHSQ
jgi:hypothetical protein